MDKKTVFYLWLVTRGIDVDEEFFIIFWNEYNEYVLRNLYKFDRYNRNYKKIERFYNKCYEKYKNQSNCT